ncbi:MAG: UDP-N-acetylmuramoyl-tripeptide--D-alanyl-D-alanine ligase [Eubacteriales bacterium]
MRLFTESEILEATGGILIGAQVPGIDDVRVVDSVSTDTRSLEPGALFVALVGERFDGHSFCQTAYEKDASLFLISDEHMLPKGAAGILVPDTLLALHALARAYRRKLTCKVIAVTGSVGKTSTREMLYAALSHTLRTHATKHNLNNEIGMPLTILSAPSDTQLLIVEMGMRMRGEIRTLARIAEPDLAIITNVGVSHIERLGSQEEILLAKMEICEGLSGDKILLINGDDRLLKDYSQKAVNRKWGSLGVTSLETSSDDLLFADMVSSASGMHMTDKGTAFSVMCRESRNSAFSSLGEFQLPCFGIHHVKNALFSIACAGYLGVSMEDVKRGLLSFKPTGSRGRIIETANYSLYDDSYNASPESMAAAFESVRLLAAGRRKIAVLGDILELGAFSAGQHYKVGEAAAKSGIDMLFICGNFREDVKSGAVCVHPELPVRLFGTRDELTTALIKSLCKGDVVLIKASHAFEMEKVTQAIIDAEKEFSMPSGKGAPL